jgi:multimeric flavodoxin WrbA
MKIVTILGSPRTNGNTAKVLGLFEEIISKDHKIERINIVTLNIEGCRGCRFCQKQLKRPGCAQKDDTLPIFEQMMGSDAVVYASPLYCWSFTSQMKAFLDRHFCLAKGYGRPEYTTLLKGKRVALLVTCGGPVVNNADVIQVIFERFSDYLGCKIVGKYVVPFCTAPDAIGSEAMETVKKMASDIAGVC